MLEFRTSVNLRQPLLAAGDEGVPGQSLVSGGTGNPPEYDHRVKFVNSSTEPTDPYEGLVWFNLDTGVKAEYVITASGGKWVELTASGISIFTGAVITETSSAAIASGSRTINPQSESSLILTIPITGDFAFNFNAPQVESLRLTNYSWTGTIRFTYTSGILSFFVGTVDYTVAWEEGAPPVFETATEYIIGVTIHGPTEEIRLSVIKGIPKVTGTATITVGPTPPSSPSVNDIWFPTS
jgi:hypothetical protein